MRILALAFVTSTLAFWPLGSAAAADMQPAKMEHPGEVALSQDRGAWVYKSFPGQTRLFISDRDRPGKSSCDAGCASAWPPIVAPTNETRVGDWTTIEREDGVKQWAYKGKPVYTRYHDVTNDLVDGKVGEFRLLKP